MVQYNKIFIIGCGRSGTHWLGRLLTLDKQCGGTTTDVSASGNTYIAKIRSLFETAMYYPDEAIKVFPEIYNKYNRCRRQIKAKYYVDKTHGALWFADSVSHMFPDAKFIGIERTVHSVAASLLYRNNSMKMRRSGDAWKKYPLPTGPSGITSEIAKIYGTLSMPQRAALVWNAHKYKMRRMKTVLHNKLHVVQYEDLLKDLPGEIEKINKFFDLNIIYNKKERPNLSSNLKWKKEFLVNDEENINKILTMKLVQSELVKLSMFHEKKKEHIDKILGR